MAQWQDKRIQGELAVLCMIGYVVADGGIYAQGVVDDNGHVDEGVVGLVRRAIRRSVLSAQAPRAEVQRDILDLLSLAAAVADIDPDTLRE